MQTRLQRLRRWLIIGALAAFAATAVVSVFLFLSPVLLFALMPYDFRTISEVEISDLSKDTGLAFPPDAKITHFEEKPPIDPIWIARVAMSSSAEVAFAASVTAHPAANTEVSGALSESIVWWKPRDVIVQRAYDHPASSALVTVIVSRESGQTVAYVEHAVF